MNILSQKNILLSLVAMTLSLLLGACGSTSTQPTTSSPKETKTEKPAPFTYADSTILIAEETASVSMRATFSNKDNSTMTEGYKFQFRSINSEVVFVSSISIVAGGARIFLEEGQIALPKEKGITLQLSLEESLNIAQYETALFQFRFDNESFLMEIALHKLGEYLP